MHDVDDFARLVDDQLSWAREVIWDEIGSSDQLRLMDELEAVTRRASDPSLYVAVFGEFSSGKSTLLNALLGESLLPSSSLVTTSVPTLLRPADERWLRVRLDGSGDWLTLGEPAFRTWYRRAVGRAAPKLVSTALRTLLTTERAASDLAEIEVGVPATILGDGVVIVDTPGFNATEARHRELALAAARRTDLAVVVVPATAPVSLSLGEFVTGELADQLTRCVFVLGKGRLFDADEQADLVRWTVRRLEDLGVSDPLVLEAPSADEALKALESGRRDDPAVDRLAELAQALGTFAARHHRPAVEASIRSLLGDLMASLQASASSEREQLRKAEQDLASMRVADLEKFLEAWSGPTKDVVRRAGLKIRDPLPLNQGSVSAVVTERVAAAISSDQLQALAGELPQIVDERFGAGAKSLLRKQADTARDHLARALDALAADFAKEYGRLAALSNQTTAPVTLRADRVKLSSTTVDLSKAFKTTTDSSAKLVSDEKWATGAGAGVGAVIGTILLPGVGTVIGGFLGALFGGISETKRAAFKAEVERAVAQAERKVESAVRKDLDRIVRLACDEVDRIAGIYAETFGPDVAELVAEEARRRSVMAERIQAATRVIDETKRRRALLVGRQ